MRHIPNILSAFRIVLIPFFIVAIVKENLVTAAVILLISGITDTLDGTIARRNGWITQLGKVLDPLADKLTQITVSVVFMIRYPQFWPILAIMLLKELVMLALGGYVVKNGAKVHGSRWFGKVTTCVFYFTMVFMLFAVSISETVVLVLLCINLICTLVAAFMYLPDFRVYRKSVKNPDEPDEKSDDTI